MSSIEKSGNEKEEKQDENWNRLFRQLNVYKVISCVAMLDLRKIIFFCSSFFSPIGPTHDFLSVVDQSVEANTFE